MTNSETPTLFDSCTPRQDVIAGDIPEDQFAASIDSKVNWIKREDVLLED